MIETLKGLAGWLALMVGLFLLLGFLLFGVRGAIDYSDECHAKGGVIVQGSKCVQEVKVSGT